MDEADREMEMEQDPFLAAGIDIPEELPYKEESGKISNEASIEPNIISKKVVQDKEELLLSNIPMKNLKDFNNEKNDQTEVTIEKSFLNEDIVKNSNFEQNDLNHEMKEYSQLSLEQVETIPILLNKS